MTFSDAKEFIIKSNNISATVSACDGTLKVIISLSFLLNFVLYPWLPEKRQKLIIYCIISQLKHVLVQKKNIIKETVLFHTQNIC